MAIAAREQPICWKSIERRQKALHSAAPRSPRRWAYNHVMDWPRLRKVVAAVALPAVGWVGAPLVKSWLEGTPLKGLHGTWEFWSKEAAQPIPAWAGALALALGCVAVVSINKWRKRLRDKTDLRIVVLPAPPPGWGMGAMGNVPYLSAHLHVRLAHRSETSLEIVNGYLEGTTPEAPFLPFIVAGPYDPSHTVHLGVRPIVAAEGKSLTRRVVLVDQFGDKHRTEKVTFRPTTNPSEHFGSGNNPTNCHFCHQPIALEELAAAGAMPAHKKCIR